jgi:hypothetical protein
LSRSSSARAGAPSSARPANSARGRNRVRMKMTPHQGGRGEGRKAEGGGRRKERTARPFFLPPSALRLPPPNYAMPTSRLTRVNQLLNSPVLTL